MLSGTKPVAMPAETNRLTYVHYPSSSAVAKPVVDARYQCYERAGIPVESIEYNIAAPPPTLIDHYWPINYTIVETRTEWRDDYLTIAFTNGLSNPYISKLDEKTINDAGTDGTTGCAVELAILFDRLELNSSLALHHSWPITVLYLASVEIALWGAYAWSQFVPLKGDQKGDENGGGIRPLKSDVKGVKGDEKIGVDVQPLLHDSITLELCDLTHLPSEFLDPDTKRAAVLLSIPRPGVNCPPSTPLNITLKNNQTIRIILVKLLSHAECLKSRTGGATERLTIASQSLKSSLGPKYSFASDNSKPKSVRTHNDLMRSIAYQRKHQKAFIPASSDVKTNAKSVVNVDDNLKTDDGNDLRKFVADLPTPEQPATTNKVAAEPSIRLSDIAPLVIKTNYEPPVPTSPLTRNFLPSDHVFGLIMGGFDHFLRTLTAQATVAARVASTNSSGATAPVAVNSVAQEVVETAKLIMNFIQTITQMAGWVHVSSYLDNPQLYKERMRANADTRTACMLDGDLYFIPSVTHPLSVVSNTSVSTIAALTTALSSPIESVSDVGQMVFKKLLHRLEWYNRLANVAKRNFDPLIAVEMMSIDGAWCEEAVQFIKDCESRVTALLEKTPQKFNEFRELQGKGVQWPHSAQLRRDIEKAGFVYRPMMIKRDRCLCETCGVEVSGWRAYHDPRSFHNYDKHPPAFRLEQQLPDLIISAEEFADELSISSIMFEQVAPFDNLKYNSPVDGAFRLSK